MFVFASVWSFRVHILLKDGVGKLGWHCFSKWVHIEFPKIGACCRSAPSLSRRLTPVNLASECRSESDPLSCSHTHPSDSSRSQLLQWMIVNTLAHMWTRRTLICPRVHDAVSGLSRSPGATYIRFWFLRSAERWTVLEDSRDRAKNIRVARTDQGKDVFIGFSPLYRGPEYPVFWYCFWIRRQYRHHYWCRLYNIITVPLTFRKIQLHIVYSIVALLLVLLFDSFWPRRWSVWWSLFGFVSLLLVLGFSL